MTAAEFAEAEGLSPSSLSWWSWRLRKAQREGEEPFAKPREEEVVTAGAMRHEPGSDDGRPHVGADGALLRFLPVRIRHQQALEAGSGVEGSEPLEIHLANGRMVVARPGVDRDWLAEMLRVIEQPGVWTGQC
jgi:hypothetical protein